MPVPSAAGDLLTEGQRRHITASLAHVAAGLAEIESIATERDRQGRSLLDGMTRDLPDGFERAVELPLAGAYAALADLVEALDLEPKAGSAARTVQALVISSLVVLEDAGTKYLRGYGPIHYALPQALEPALQRLHVHVATIGEILTASSRESSPGGPHR